MKSCKFFVSLTLFVGGLFFGAALIIRMDLDKPVRALEQKENADLLDQDSIGQVLSLERAFIDVAEKAGEAVVSISTERTTSSGEYFYSPFGGGGDFFEKFFEDFFGEIPKREFKSMGLGSGIIIASEGYILTNEHVIHNADKITVTLSNGEEFKATLVGRDYRSDLAVLKIEARDLSSVKLGDAENVKIGQWAIAIGNPFGFAVDSPKPTVTVGVISALHRSLPATEYRDRIYTDLIQTDAAINPGNSGGPLLNIKGEVIGINVAIYTTSGGYQGVGFAIPVNQAKYVLDKLLKGEEVEYGWLGVQIQDLDQELAAYLEVPDRKGALVGKVIKNGPAENAGIKEGDVIRKLDGVIVENTKDLMNKVMHTKVGKDVVCEIIRDKKTVELKIKLGNRPLDTDNIEIDSEEYSWRGIIATDLSEDLKKEYKVTNGGVIVSKVNPNSLAQDVGIRKSDVIFEINKNIIRDLEDFKKITAITEGKALIRTQRGYALISP
ncbi:MAG: Do family serine endopeptidase [Candidatus Saelkia tenebricola]|nr:Do family serine endopeptidase [Candidatus Saelkia tenebricola]